MKRSIHIPFTSKPSTSNPVRQASAAPSKSAWNFLRPFRGVAIVSSLKVKEGGNHSVPDCLASFPDDVGVYVRRVSPNVVLQAGRSG